MKSRAFVCALFAGVVSLASGCCCLHNCFPNVGWRLHQGCCTPACSSPPVCAPCGFRPPMVVSGGPDCPSCAHGGMGTNTPIGYPPVAYPPIIGNPQPIPGASIAPGGELHAPMPVKGQ